MARFKGAASPTTVRVSPAWICTWPRATPFLTTARISFSSASSSLGKWKCRSSPRWFTLFRVSASSPSGWFFQLIELVGQMEVHLQSAMVHAFQTEHEFALRDLFPDAGKARHAAYAQWSTTDPASSNWSSWSRSEEHTSEIQSLRH